MKLDINREQKKINQQFVNKMKKSSDIKVVKLTGGLKGVYNPLLHWGKIIDLNFQIKGRLKKNFIRNILKLTT